MDFELSEDLQILQQAAREFAEAELAPRAAASDEAESFVAEQIKLCAEMGFLGMTVPETYGGSELDIMSRYFVIKIDAQIDQDVFGAHVHGDHFVDVLDRLVLANDIANGLLVIRSSKTRVAKTNTGIVSQENLVEIRRVPGLNIA